MGNRPSFPTTGEAFRGYVRDSLLRYDLDEEEEEEEEMDEAEPEPDRDADLVAHEARLEDVHEINTDDDEEES
jgi:hypothetical protein